MHWSLIDAEDCKTETSQGNLGCNSDLCFWCFGVFLGSLVHGGKKFLANSLLRFALTGCCGAAHGVTQHHSHSRWLLLPLTPPVTSRDPPGQGSVCENVFNFKVEKVNSVSVQLERASMIRAVVKAELQDIMGWIRSSLFLFYDML